MEQDIIVEGFCESVERHKLQYHSYIGDGYSNTFGEIRKRTPYGPETSKIECANHVVVRFSDHLHGLTSNTKIPCAARNHLKAVDEETSLPRLERLVKGVRVAIKNAAKNDDVDGLRRDLANAPFHVFGRHQNCGLFCTRGDSEEQDLTPFIENSGLMAEIKKYIDKLIHMADSLVYDDTTNQAERFMSLVSKLNGGERIAKWKGGGYYYSTQGATIRVAQIQKLFLRRSI